MTKLMMFLMLISLLMGCGQTHQQDVTQDPTFDSYLSDFEAVGAKYIGIVPLADITTRFADDGELKGTVLGECSEGAGYKDIAINRKKWDTASEVQRRVTMFHELGHCALGRQHLNGYAPVPYGHPGWTGNIAVSIMNAYQISDAQYIEFQAEYDRELFLGGR